VRRIHFWQHTRAAHQMLRAYPPGTDALIDQIRAFGFFKRFLALRIVFPLYFAREQGWVIRGERRAIAAVMYLRRNTRHGITVMHIDDINVDARYRRRGYAQRLMNLAEELARKEHRPYLKLAVTVANMPAVTLYRRLGYQAQHHRYFTFVPPSVAQRPTPSADVTLRPMRRREAEAVKARLYRLELQTSVPAVAEMMAVYYPRGAGVHVPKTGDQRYAIEQGGRQIGYGIAYCQRGQWQLGLSVLPELWGSNSERQAILLLGSSIENPDGVEVALHVWSGAHFDALCSGSPPLASELGMTQHNYDRMIMAKALVDS
jgi:GNAT superfamily N-acetyltransferase